MKNFNNKKGFTIVELVIVIAVIGILAGVLIPTFSGIVGNANQKAALSDVRAVLTNALNMSSTAQLAGKTNEGDNSKYQTVFVMNYSKKSQNAPEYAYGYDGNELVALNIKYDSNKMTADGLDLNIVNSVLLSSKAIKATTSGTGESATTTYDLDSLTQSILEKTYGVSGITVSKSGDAFEIKLGPDQNANKLTAYTSVDLPLHIAVLTKFG